MSRIICVTLLLIVVAGTFYSSTAAQGFRMSKVHIRKCRCTVFPTGKIKCRYPRLPTNHEERHNLIQCLCSKANQHRFPEFKAACSSWRPGIPISLV